MQQREIDQDGPCVMAVLEAQEALYLVRDMTPEQRKKSLPDLEEAAAFLSMAIKECA